VAAVVVVVAGEVAAAVVEAVAEAVVVGGRSPFDTERDLTPISGWTGGNSDPIRNSRW
jgi:hypothetical protein